jgi:hypothetical protein
LASAASSSVRLISILLSICGDASSTSDVGVGACISRSGLLSGGDLLESAKSIHQRRYFSLLTGALSDIASLVITLMSGAKSRIINLLLACISCCREAKLAEVEASSSPARSQ